jgi:glucose/arabinose dehydrogenase
MSEGWLRGGVVKVCLALCAALALGGPSQASAQDLPTGFSDTTVLSGLRLPTTMRFLPDGSILVEEKGGLIKHFDGPGDTTPTTVINRQTATFDPGDRGMLGLAIDPNYPTNHFIYALYTRNAELGHEAPQWGLNGVDDNCPQYPDGCQVSGRLERFTLSANGEQLVDNKILVTDWCQQYSSHSIGSLAFDSTGALYASGGEGASFDWPDYGQAGNPKNPCGDPPTGSGGTQTVPTAEGGALRAQDIRTTGPTDPTGLAGSVIRIDPATGDPLPDNPEYVSGADANARRIVAYGFRNPFRFTFRPGTDELWVGDVGWGTIEEIDRVPYGQSQAMNFGWPCYEGVAKQPNFDALNVNLCESLYTPGGTTTGPYYQYDHHAQPVATDGCPTGGSAISGLAFTAGDNFPPAYDGALFFADYSRKCIWVMRDTDHDGIPEPAHIERFHPNSGFPVDLQFGPDGSLYYVDILDGQIRKVTYNGPKAVISATPTSGDAPLLVQFGASGTTDPDDQFSALSFAWDLDGDGAYDDSTDAAPTWTYTHAGTYTAGLQVTDPAGNQSIDTVQINASNGAPVPAIDAPTGTLHWSVGDQISVHGSATDPEDGVLAPEKLNWSIVMLHCPPGPAGCHQHFFGGFTGTDHGSFIAPDHDYPSSLIFELTATDSGNRSTTTSVTIDPKTAQVILNSNPQGAEMTLDLASQAAPLEQTVIYGSSHSVGAAPDAVGVPWASWSDGGERLHQITANGASTTLTATYLAPPTDPTDPTDPTPTDPTPTDPTPTDPTPTDPTPTDPGTPPGEIEAPPVFMCQGVNATVLGTDTADTIAGTPNDDVIVAGYGNDKIRSGGGDDLVCAGDGNDEIHGGGGADSLRGGGGADHLWGGSGPNAMSGGPGPDRCDGARSDKRSSC